MKAVTFKTANTPHQLKYTIRLIGKAIKSGSLFLPIRHLAARTATTAPPKNYNKQIQAVYNAITQRWWRYTFDPQGAEVLTLDGPRIYDLTLGRGSPNHIGYGDCDDITIASGALLRSIGMDVRVLTTSPPGSPHIFTHVFLQVKAPKSNKWIVFDPVLYPKQGLGNITRHQRVAFWNLEGNLIKKSGSFPPRFNEVMNLYGTDQAERVDTNHTGKRGLSNMSYLNTRNPNFHDFFDYSDQSGLFGDAGDLVDESNPAHMKRLQDDNVLADFARDGIIGFGCYSGLMGIIQGDQTPDIMFEVDGTDEIGDTGLVATKHFELAPDDFAHLQKTGVVPMGTMALADDGEVYEWEPNVNGLGGFFKKMFRKVKKRVKKVRRKIKKKIKKFMKRTKFGRKLWKIGSKIKKTALKIVKPLMKVIGPLAKKLAPIAAFIPGIGPAVAGALMVTGKVYDIAKKVGVKFDKFKKPIIKNKAQGRAFSKLLAASGRSMGTQRAKRVIQKLKRARCGHMGDADIFEGSMLSGNDVNAYHRMPAAYVGWF